MPQLPMPFPGCATTLDDALDAIEEFLDDHTDGAPDAPLGRKCGMLLAQLQYVRSRADISPTGGP